MFSPSRFYVFATIPVKPECLEEARAAILEIMPATLAEEGCDVFELYEDPSGAPRLFLREVFRDEAAFELHHQQDFVREIFRKYEEWLDGEVVTQQLRPVLRPLPERPDEPPEGWQPPTKG
ncbi:MAG: putative quinol monooxygenase [Verrucomicrobiota bacterium]